MKLILSILTLCLLLGCSRTISNADKGLFPIKEFGKYGYIDNEGKTIIKCQFEWAGEFSEGLAPFQQDTLYGFIDINGNIKIKPKYIEVSKFSEGFCTVKSQIDTTFQTTVIKSDGTIAFKSEFEDIGLFKYGRAAVIVNEDVCFIDSLGKVVINTHFPYGSNTLFQDGVAMVWTGDSSKYIDTSGKIIALFPQMGNDGFSEGLARIELNGESFFIDKTGKPKLKLKNDSLTYFSFSDGMAQAFVAGSNSDNRNGFIDTTGKLVIPLSFSSVYDFKEGLAAFRVESLWGFINKKGKVVIKPQFDEVEFEGFKKGLCKARIDHQWGYINQKGEFVWKEQIGIEYDKIDLTKWKLDTLNIDKPICAVKYASHENFPRKQKLPSPTKLIFKIDTTDLTVFSDRYFAYKLFLINTAKYTLNIPVQDGRVTIIQQAINKNGEWQDIENFINSWCGVGYRTVHLMPLEYLIFPTPIYRGNFKTKLRFKLKLDKKEIYSNIFMGQINLGQFLNPNDRDRTRIALRTN